MRVKQRATQSFISANKPAISQMGPSAHYKLLFKDPAAMFRKLRDEDGWYLSENPHRPTNYSSDWRAEMQRASDEAQSAERVEQAGTQIQTSTTRIFSIGAQRAPPNAPPAAAYQRIFCCCPQYEVPPRPLRGK